MNFQTRCPECSRKLAVPKEALGKKIKCPACASVFRPQIPTPADSSASEIATSLRPGSDQRRGKGELGSPVPETDGLTASPHEIPHVQGDVRRSKTDGAKVLTQNMASEPNEKPGKRISKADTSQAVVPSLESQRLLEKLSTGSSELHDTHENDVDATRKESVQTVVSSSDSSVDKQALLDKPSHASSNADFLAQDQSVANGATNDLCPKTVGRFEVRKELGAGGFGSVYQAYDPILDREIALKVPRPKFDKDELNRRVLQEAKAASRLRHPNIVAVYEVGPHLAEPFIATELVDGESLSTKLKASSETSTLEQKVEWLVSICRGLAYAHSEGIVHRDIKPHNVLIDANGRAMLADFGLATRHNELESDNKRNVLIGTPAYMSPEQARGDQSQVGPASDQYSVGVMLYEILVGEKPFVGSSYDVLARVIDEPVKPPSALKKVASRDLEAICLKALSKLPADRYTDCAALADDLQNWLNGELVEATNPTWITRTRHWSKKRPQLAAWSVAAAVAIFATFGTVASATVYKYVTIVNEKEAAESALIVASNEASVVKKQVVDTEYSSRLQKVAHYIESNNIENAHAILDRIPWEERGIEHGLLRRRMLGTPFIMHAEYPVESISWLSSGTVFATVANHTLQFWDGETGTPLGRAELDSITTADFHPTRSELLTTQTMATSPKSTRIAIWGFQRNGNAVELQLLRQTQSDIVVKTASINPSGQEFAVGALGSQGKSSVELRSWHAENLQLRSQPMNIKSTVLGMAFTQNGSRLDCAVDTGTPLSNGTSCWPTFVFVDQANPEGNQFLPMVGDMSFQQSQQLNLTRTQSYNAMEPVVSNLTVDTEASTPQSQVYAFGKLLSWNGACLAPSPNVATNQYVSTALMDKQGIKWFGIKDGRLGHGATVETAKMHLGHSAAISCLAMRPDGECLASADSKGQIRLWPLADQGALGCVASTVPCEEVSQIADNFNGTLAACTTPSSTSSGLIIWNTLNGSTFATLPGHEQGVHALAFHPTKNEMISVDGTGTVRVWDIESQNMIRSWNVPTASVLEVSYSNSGQSVCIAGGEESAPYAAVWDIANGRELLRMNGHSGKVLNAQFAQGDTEVITSATDSTIRRWKVIDGQLVETLKTEGFIAIDLAVSSTQLLAAMVEPCGLNPSGQGYRSKIRGWELDKGASLFDISESNVAFRHVSFDKAGSRFVATTGRGYNIYSAETGQLLFADQEFPFTRSETRTRMYTVTVYQVETRTRTVQKTIMQEEARTREVPQTVQVPVTKSIMLSMIRGTAEKDAVEIGKLSVPDGTRVQTILNSQGAALVSEEAINQGVYVKLDGVKLYFYGDAEFKKRIEFSPTTADGGRVILHLRGKIGDSQFEKTYTSYEPRTETRTETYTVAVPVTVQEEVAYTVRVPVTEMREQSYTVLLPFDFRLSNAKISNDGSKLLLIHDQKPHVLDANLPYQIRELTGESAQYTTVVVSPDKSRIAAIGEPNITCSACGCSLVDIWSATDGRLLKTIDYSGHTVNAISFGRNANELLVATGCGFDRTTTTRIPVTITEEDALNKTRLELVDLTTGEIVRTFYDGEDAVLVVSVSNRAPSEALVLHESGRLVLMDLDRGTTRDIDLPGTISAQLSPDGAYILATNNDGERLLLRADDPSQRVNLNAQQDVDLQSIVFSGDAESLLAAAPVLTSRKGAGQEDNDSVEASDVALQIGALPPQVWSGSDIQGALTASNLQQGKTALSNALKHISVPGFGVLLSPLVDGRGYRALYTRHPQQHTATNFAVAASRISANVFDGVRVGSSSTSNANPPVVVWDGTSQQTWSIPVNASAIPRENVQSGSSFVSTLKRSLILNGTTVDVHGLRITRDGIETIANRYTWPKFLIDDREWDTKPEKSIQFSNDHWLRAIPDLRSIQVAPTKLDAYCHFHVEKSKDSIEIGYIHSPAGNGTYNLELRYDSSNEFVSEIDWRGTWTVDALKLNGNYRRPTDLQSVLAQRPIASYQTSSINFEYWSRDTNPIQPTVKDDVMDYISLPRFCLLHMQRKFVSNIAPVQLEIYLDGVCKVAIDGVPIDQDWMKGEVGYISIIRALEAGEHVLDVSYLPNTDIARVAVALRNVSGAPTKSPTQAMAPAPIPAPMAPQPQPDPSS